MVEIFYIEPGMLNAEMLKCCRIVKLPSAFSSNIKQWVRAQARPIPKQAGLVKLLRRALVRTFFQNDLGMTQAQTDFILLF